MPADADSSAQETDEASSRNMPTMRALVRMVTPLRRRAPLDQRRAWPSSSFAAQLMATQLPGLDLATPAEAGTAYLTAHRRMPTPGLALRRRA
jgi:hypothetical protein